MTAELRADDLHVAFGPDAVVLPDGWIEESSAEDWPVVLAAITGDGATAIWASDHAPVLEEDLGERTALNETFSVVLSPGVQLDLCAGPEVLFDMDLHAIYALLKPDSWNLEKSRYDYSGWASTIA